MQKIHHTYYPVIHYVQIFISLGGEWRGVEGSVFMSIGLIIDVLLMSIGLIRRLTIDVLLTQCVYAVFRHSTCMLHAERLSRAVDRWQTLL